MKLRLNGPIIAALASAAVALLVLFALVVPKATQVKAKDRDLESAREQASTLRLQVHELQSLAKTAPQTRAKLATLNAEVPPTADLPGLIRLLNTAAEESGVDFMSMSPGTPEAASTGTASVIPVQMSLSGSFFALDQYLLKLEGLPRASKVLSVGVTPITGNTGASGLQMTLVADFFTTDTSAGPGSEPGGAAGSGGGTDTSGNPAPTPSSPFGSSPAPSVPGPTPSASPG